MKFILVVSFTVLVLVKALSLRRKLDEATRQIPKIIFRTFEDPLAVLHPKLLSVFDQTISNNPDYVMVYVDDSERDEFIATHYPGYIERYRSVVPSAYRADVFRMLIVYKYGGVYCDMGLMYAVKLNAIISNDDQFVVSRDLQKSALYNAFFAAYTRHPVIKQMIVEMMDNINYERYGCNTLDITGPQTFGRAFHHFLGIVENDTEDIKLGNYSIGAHKYHILGHQSTKSQKASHGSSMIYDDNVLVIRNKFDGYKEVVYRNHSHRYNDFWDALTVYNTTYTNKTLAIKHEGKLIRDGTNYYYIVDGKRKGFVNQKQMLSLGFQECQAYDKLRHKHVVKIPLGKKFSVDLAQGRREKLSNLYLPNYLQELDAQEDVTDVAHRVQQVIDQYKQRVITYRQFMNAVSK